MGNTAERTGRCAVVLVVDDNEEILKMVKSALEDVQAEVLTATTAADAAKLAQENSFDLAILDIYLPDGTGLQLARKIKAEDPKLPVIMITGLPDSRNVHGSLDIDADGYLIKPINVCDTVALAEDLMERYRLCCENKRSGEKTYRCNQ